MRCLLDEPMISFKSKGIMDSSLRMMMAADGGYHLGVAPSQDSSGK